MTTCLQKSATGELTERTDANRGVLDAAQGGRRYDLRRYKPSAALAPFVEQYWLIEWDFADTGYTVEILPLPRVNIAFIPDREWLAGVITEKYAYDLEGRGVMLGMQFRVGGFRPFLGRPVSTITDRILRVGDIFPAATDAFRRAMLDGSDSEIIADGEALLGDRPLVPDPNIDLVNDIVDAVAADRSLLRVGEVADRFGLSERTLQGLFSNYVGIGLKWVIRRYRIVEAVERIEAGTEASWTDLAYDLGYADQAHFTNDFTRIVGRPPTDHARLVGALA